MFEEVKRHAACFKGILFLGCAFDISCGNQNSYERSSGDLRVFVGIVLHKWNLKAECGALRCTVATGMRDFMCPQVVPRKTMVFGQRRCLSEAWNKGVQMFAAKKRLFCINCHRGDVNEQCDRPTLQVTYGVIMLSCCNGACAGMPGQQGRP